MLKKIFLTAFLAAAAVISFPLRAQETEEPAPMTTVAEPETAPGTVVEELPEEQAMITTAAVNSTEVNTVEESEIARKMKQAEKARNVKENDSWGGAITIIAMCIVMGALIVLSILFNMFGKVSQRLLTKKKLASTGKTMDDVDDDHDHIDSGEVIAAISAALAEHFNDRHDVEDYILTIRRMRRAYSPWNSKIYNLRHNPELEKNPARPLPAIKNVK